MCFKLENADESRFICGTTGSLADGSAHRVTGCVTGAGALSLHLDGTPWPGATAQTAPPGLPDVAPPDLNPGSFTVGGGVRHMPWHGYIRWALACRGSDPAACRW
jgi:hypothetical protein